MTLNHKFYKYDFYNGFATNDAILNVLPYEPEVIFIGTFNPDWNWNLADMFYGSGMYMWSILSNLFLHKSNLIEKARQENINPTLDEIFEVCRIGKITFADIIIGVDATVEVHSHEKLCIVGGSFEWDSYKDKQLEYMAAKDWLIDNATGIINYINSTPSIKYVYFTFKSGIWLVKKMNEILSRITVSDKGSIFTPSGNGFGSLLPNHLSKIASLTHCWIWNDVDKSVNKTGYIHLSHEWLISKGVPINLF